MLDVARIKHDFPILSRTVHGKPLVYLDSAATSQKPQQVISAISEYYLGHTANVHRGVHTLSDESTTAWEQARATIAGFFGAKPTELIVVRNTTEAINGLAYGWADYNLKPFDIVVVSQLEHHSNLVVWQQVCKRTGAELKVVPVLSDGQFDYEWLESNSDGCKLFSFSHVSNALGTVLDVPRVSALAKQIGARVHLDGAQSAPHLPINFASLGVDFFSFSGHKLLGPMGSGGLLVKESILANDEMRPWLFGGGMIAEVSEQKTLFHEDITERFTAGTPDVASAVGLAAACEYLQNIGMQKVFEHDQELVKYALSRLAQLPQIEIVGPQEKRVGSVSFIYKGVHAHDVAQVLDSEGVAVRSGHHCTMPLHTACNWIATVRASFQVYTDISDIDALVLALKKVANVFGK